MNRKSYRYYTKVIHIHVNCGDINIPNLENYTYLGESIVNHKLFNPHYNNNNNDGWLVMWI